MSTGNCILQMEWQAAIMHSDHNGRMRLRIEPEKSECGFLKVIMESSEWG